MTDVLSNNLEEIRSSDIHSRIPSETDMSVEKGKDILLSVHREENIDTDKNFLSLFNAINAMADKYDIPILYSCHPRSRNKLEKMTAYCVVSDSGSLPEESSYFTSIDNPFPAVCIRTSTERPEALDKACFILSGISSEALLKSVDLAVSMNENSYYGIPVPDYIDTNVSMKVVKIIQSYKDTVNKFVWRKES